MILRHAAALALVGWYLMIPPMVHKENWPPVNPVPTAPLGKWFTWNWFDTADACTKERSALIARGEGNAFNDYRRWLAGREPSDDLLDEWTSAYSLVYAINEANHRSMCIATDDPRLKGN